MKYFLLIYSLLILPFTLSASQDDLSKSKGITQDVIVQLMPSPAQEDVSRYTKIEASFSVPLDAKHVKKFDVKLKCLSCKTKNNIKGTVGYVEADKKVTFNPAEPLTPGVYEVEFKSLKAEKAHKDVKIKEIKYRFLVVKEVLESITVTPNSINLIEGETQQLTVIGHYDNGTQKKLMPLLEWIVGNSQTISVNDNGLVTALTAGNTTLQAKQYKALSAEIPVEVLIPDVVPPVITLQGEETVKVFKNGNYEERGATALDERDGNVSVDINGTVDTTAVGTYTITYTATDKAGNKAETTRTVNVVIPQLVSLALESNATSLNLGEKASLTVTGTYEDNSTKELTSDIEWIMTPSNSIDVNGTVITVLKDINTTLQAKVINILSNSLNLELYWEVNGHRLPPEPDPTVNNSTLLGIDVNDNGVRDDVERWIYMTYKDKHPIHIDIAMQAGRAYKKVLETPEKAKEIMEFVEAPLYCELYYRYCVDNVNINEKRILDENEEINNKYFRKKIYFNTDERWSAYIEYDTLFSGDSYTLIRCSKRKQLCDFDTTKYEE